MASEFYSCPQAPIIPKNLFLCWSCAATRQRLLLFSYVFVERVETRCCQLSKNTNQLHGSLQSELSSQKRNLVKKCALVFVLSNRVLHDISWLQGNRKKILCLRLVLKSYHNG